MNSSFALFLCLLTSTSATALAQTTAFDSPVTTRGPSSRSAAMVVAEYGKIPLSFEANQGQTDPAVRFLSRGSGYSLFLTDDAAVLALTKPATHFPKQTHLPNQQRPTSNDVIRMKFLGASAKAEAKGTEPQPGSVNYLIGNDPNKWHTNLPTYGRVKYTGVYPGIDLVYYGNQSQLEYDLLVAPGADPHDVRLGFTGATKVALASSGDLTITAANGEISFHKPLVYQVKDGRSQSIDSRFTLLSKNAVGFSLGAYDHSRALVIDPVLAYSTYFDQATPQFIGVDAAGYAYIAGLVASGANFPLSQTPVQPVNPADGFSATTFITKFNAAGSALVYSTFLGGGAGDTPSGIAVDKAGNVYVTGLTCSSNFPRTANALPADLDILCTTFDNGSPGGLASYITKLNTGGSSFGYSNVLNSIQSNAIAVDNHGSAYVTGYLDSSNLPVTDGVVQPTYNGQDETPTAFVLKLDPTGSTVDYATYLGGSGYIDNYSNPPNPPIVENVYGDMAFGIAVDSSGDAYVAGETFSADFPVTAHAYQTALAGNPYTGPAGAGNAFVSKLDPNGASLIYSTYLGGNQNDGFDGARAIAIDKLASAYVTGVTGSSNFPTTSGAFETTNTQGEPNFVTKLSPDGSSLAYSTYFNYGSFAAITVDAQGDAFLAGQAVTGGFPLTAGALQPTNTTPSIEPVFSESNPKAPPCSFPHSWPHARNPALARRPESRSIHWAIRTSLAGEPHR